MTSFSRSIQTATDDGYETGAGTPIIDAVGLNLPGVSGSVADTPDSDSLDIGGDIDIRVEFAPSVWPQTNANAAFIARWNGGATPPSARFWEFVARTDGRVQFFWTEDGGTGLSATSNVMSPTAGVRTALRVTLDVNNGSGQKVVTFYTASTIAGPWTVFQTVTTSGTTSIWTGPPSTTVIVGGAFNTGTNAFAGRMFKVEVYSGIDGTPVMTPDFSAQTPGTTSFTDSAGKTWTVKGTAQIATDNLLIDSLLDSIGLRFQDLPIVGEGRINSAFLTVSLSNTNRVSASGNWSAEQTDDASTFTTTAGDIENRISASEFVSWSNANLGSYGASVTTPDLSEVIQQIIDRPGWVSGNDIVLLFVGNSGDLELASFGHLTLDAAELFVDWSYVDPNPVELHHQDQSTRISPQEQSRINFQETAR